MSTTLAPIPSTLDAALRRSREFEAAIQAGPTRFRVLTGDRPTGPLHVGHLFGTLLNRVRLQALGVEVLVLVADYQTLTDRDAPETLPADVLALVADHLAVGIDPARSTIFAHSQVSGLNQLVLPFLSLVSLAELGRNPTVKDEFAASGGEAMSGLMFTYPVHQAADILFCHANLVPVGRDQLPHLELTRAVARRFNDRYSPARPYFPEPEALLTDAPHILGLDGRKMSKSRGNAIALADTAERTARMIKGARTDGDRSITYDPVHRPEVANLLTLTAASQGRSPEQVADEIGRGGAQALKVTLTEALNERLRPIRARRLELLAEPGYLREVLVAGNERARALADTTLDAVQRLMHTRY